jgi:arylsulfatase A-like enzyme
MSDDHDSRAGQVSRRDFLRNVPAAASLPLTASLPLAASSLTAASPPRARPNVILLISDQFRGDCLGANGRTPLHLTPNLDAMAAEGTNFPHAITNQPVCAPARACLFTGAYPTRHGVWRNGVPLPADATTIARVFRSAGYTSNYLGKWHLAPVAEDDATTLGPVPPAWRGGFDAVWEGCNILELTSHPYEGSIWDGAGREIRFDDQYRVDFLTDRAVAFLRRPAREPFFLVVSYLEPHFQNDCNCFVAPKGEADKWKNAFVPRDLTFFPGDWQAQLPDYYGCIARVDENVGRLRRELDALHLADRTIVALVSDHGCHFRTRNAEYKRSGHDSSIHVPFVAAGPGLGGGRAVRRLVSHVDVAPTLLDAAGLTVPESMQGRSAMPLVRQDGTATGIDEVFIQISESMTGRALRTPEWTYVVAVPDGQSRQHAAAYVEYQLYDLRSDPHQLVNLAGRRETRAVSARLRDRLLARMADAGDPPATIAPAPLYP